MSGQIYFDNPDLLVDGGNWAIRFATDAPSLIEGARYVAALAYDADHNLWSMSGTYSIDVLVGVSRGRPVYRAEGPYDFTADEDRPGPIK